MQLGAAAPTLRKTRIAFSPASFIETLAVIGVIALLLPAFTQLAGVGDGRDQRFARTGLIVRGLPAPSLPSMCALHGPFAETLVRERLCGGVRMGQGEPVLHLPGDLKRALVRSESAFIQPLMTAEARLDQLAKTQREGGGSLRALSDEAAAIESDVGPWLKRFKLSSSADFAGVAEYRRESANSGGGKSGGDERGPLPLLCVERKIDAALAEARSDKAGDAARANAVLLLAAALDGDSATGALANSSTLPVVRAVATPPCLSSLSAMLSEASALMADARQSSLNSRKNEAMQALMRTAGIQWAGAMLLGLVFLKASRTKLRPALGVASVLTLWAIAAWVARVPWPFSASRVFEPARLDMDRWSGPSHHLLWMAAAASTLLVWALWRKPLTTPGGQTLSTRLGYPGLVFATGIGWLLLLDLSAHAHFGNRYLALYHQGHLWLAMSVFSAMLFLRQPLARGLAWTLSVVAETTGSAARRMGSLGALGVLVLAAAVLAGAIGIPLSNMRQFTSELGRVWVIVGAAWFFFLRGGPLAERMARSGAPAGSMLRYIAPLLFVALVLLGLMLVTRDMGPLLIAGYGAGAFIAASVAAWWYQRGGRAWFALTFVVVLFAVWIAAITAALFELGAIDPLTATRLESLSAPLASTNDQLALVQWFQRATPPHGFGLGNVPWCGYAATGSCTGVPAQIHSDYTFTAIVGVFGVMAAWAMSLGCAFWLHRLIRHHGRVTSGDPCFVAASGRIANDGQAFLSWIGVAWVVLTLCQLAVTVAGNMAVLPLTGVTFPFVSFGMTSLVVNMAFLALCMNLDLPERRSDG